MHAPTIAEGAQGAARTAQRRALAPRTAATISGARAMLPWLTGLLPNALVIGVYASHSGIPAFAGWLTGPLIFAASAQLAVLELLHAGAACGVIVIVAVAINLRLVLYSAAMAEHWRGTSRRWRAFAPYFLVDPVVAVGIDGYASADDPQSGHLHYLGGALVLWASWLAAMAVGATVGSRIPHGAHLELAVPLYLAGQLVPRVTSSAVRRGAAAAGAAALVGNAVPFHLGAVVAMALGVAASSARQESHREQSHQEQSHQEQQGRGVTR
jgi:predicted branched-subunit amino acid permease